MTRFVTLFSGLLVATCLLLALVSGLNAGAMLDHASATIRYVAPGGACGSGTPCYAQVQAAVDASAPGDEIRVAAGHYTGVTSRNGSAQHVYLDKSLSIRGGYDPVTWAQDFDASHSVLDAGGKGRVLFIAGAGSPIIEGLHLVNGSAGNGGGVYVEGAAVQLLKNVLHDNKSVGSGGAVYLKASTATLWENAIYSNTAGASGHGGGVALVDSPALLENNRIEGNRAHVGGGLALDNNQGSTGAVVTGNTIRNNVAFDYEENGTTFAGAGGGIDVGSALTDTVRANLICDNVAKWGGGVHAYDARVLLVDNTIQENAAALHGGGLYAQGNQIAIEGNRVLTNTTENLGGGLSLWGVGQVRGNRFQGNRARLGGGMYASASGAYEANLFLGNTATEMGGGVLHNGGSGSVYRNNVVVGNQAGEGGAFSIWTADAAFYHTTIADNTSGDGRAVVVDRWPGATDAKATAIFSNTIVSGQLTGFYVTAGNALTVNGVLWHATATHVEATGATLAVAHEFTGDPVFQPDGYHLRAASAARDRVDSGLEVDVDGHLCDGGLLNDLGADEYVPTALIDPAEGGSLTYIDPKGEITITVTVPPNSIDEAMAIVMAPVPFPPIPHDPFADTLIGVGPAFGLVPHEVDTSDPAPPDPNDPPLGDPTDEPLVFGRWPAHVVAHLSQRHWQSLWRRWIGLN